MLIFNNRIVFSNGHSIESLLPGCYAIRIDPQNGSLYLEIQPRFETKELAGFSNDIIDLIKNHYKKTANNFGIIFSGQSGMGKTQTIKSICSELNLPVIIVDIPLDATKIKTVLHAINADCVLLFDEYEKTYGDRKEEANSLLPIFDGLDTDHRILSILSINTTDRMSEYLFGRPGRFLFNFKFNPLKPEEALEFIEQRIAINDRDRMLLFLGSIKNISYDICDKLIGIINLHGEELFIKFSNHINLVEANYRYQVIVKDGDKILCNNTIGSGDAAPFRCNGESYYIYYNKIARTFKNLKIHEPLLVESQDVVDDYEDINDETVNKLLSYTYEITKIPTYSQSKSFGY